MSAQVEKLLDNYCFTYFYHYTINTVIAPVLSGNYTIHSGLLTRELVKGAEDFPLCKDEVSLTVS